MAAILPKRFDYAIAAQKACDGVVSGECDKAVLLLRNGNRYFYGSK